MPDPALSPGHASLLTFPSTDRLPSAISAADPRIGFVRGITGNMQSSDSSPLPRRLRLLDFPSWPGASLWPGEMRSPKFRRLPSIRNGVSDHGRAVAPRVTVHNMLPSTEPNVSASAILKLSRLNSPLRMIAVYAS